MLYQALPKSSWCQISSIRPAMSAWSAPSATSAAAAWMTVPRLPETDGGLAPTADSISQRSPHVTNLSTCEGETLTSPSLIGPEPDHGVRAYHWSGLAPATPAAASLAS